MTSEDKKKNPLTGYLRMITASVLTSLVANKPFTGLRLK